MRLRFSVPLPGPFSLTSGGRPGSGLGVLLVVGLFYLGAWFAWPLTMLLIHAAVLLVAVFVFAAARFAR